MDGYYKSHREIRTKMHHPSFFKEAMIVIVTLTILGYILFGVALLRSCAMPRGDQCF